MESIAKVPESRCMASSTLAALVRTVRAWDKTWGAPHSSGCNVGVRFRAARNCALASEFTVFDEVAKAYLLPYENNVSKAITSALLISKGTRDGSSWRDQTAGMELEEVLVHGINGLCKGPGAAVKKIDADLNGQGGVGRVT